MRRCSAIDCPAFLLVCLLWLAAGLPCCAPSPAPWQPSPQAGRDVFIAERLAFALPYAYHETKGGAGRTFRERGTDHITYATIHAQPALVGAPLGLDDALSLVINRLAAQEHFEMWDVQLGFVGSRPALFYAAEFVWLDVPRRQWGLLVAEADGLINLFFTAPSSSFLEAALDFDEALSTLHTLGVEN